MCMSIMEAWTTPAFLTHRGSPSLGLAVAVLREHSRGSVFFGQECEGNPLLLARILDKTYRAEPASMPRSRSSVIISYSFVALIREVGAVFCREIEELIRIFS